MSRCILFSSIKFRKGNWVRGKLCHLKDINDYYLKIEIVIILSYLALNCLNYIISSNTCILIQTNIKDSRGTIKFNWGCLMNGESGRYLGTKKFHCVKCHSGRTEVTLWIRILCSCESFHRSFVWENTLESSTLL